MRSRWMIALAGGVVLAAFFVQLGPAQQGTGKAPAKGAKQAATIPPGDWPMYSRDLTSSRFVPLTQINTTNVANLKQVWTWRPPAPPPGADDGKGAAAGKGGGRGGGKGAAKGKGGGAPGVAAEVTPIVVNGVMYLPAGGRVVALNADTGAEIWNTPVQGNVGNRAVGYWPGDGTNPPRILFTAVSSMRALNANTGAVDPGFGKEGSVEIGQNWGGAPYVYKNLIILGVANGESTAGPAGDTRVYDARTGAHLWNFKTIAQPGDPGHETWLDDGWKQRAGVNTWGWYFTVDEERDLIFMPLGSPAGNY